MKRNRKGSAADSFGSRYAPRLCLGAGIGRRGLPPLRAGGRPRESDVRKNVDLSHLNDPSATSIQKVQHGRVFNPEKNAESKTFDPLELRKYGPALIAGIKWL